MARKDFYTSEELPYRDEAWQFLVKFRSAIESLVHHSCRGNWDLKDELRSEAYIRGLRIYHTYDPTVGTSRWQHMKRSLRMYLWKHMNSRQTHRVRHETNNSIDIRRAHYRDEEVCDRVEMLLSCLDELERWVVEARIMCGWSLQDIKSYGGIEYSSIESIVSSALDKMRREEQRRAPLKQHVRAVMNRCRSLRNRD
jgi:DNA-directed RNA polymerase specialized sigma24 family protein